MDPLTIAAASGLRSRAEALDLLGNNLANTGTAGFKADREFYRTYLATEENGNVPPGLPNIETHWTDFSQGSLTDTGNPRDLGLDGKGFFVVQGSAGPLLTRSGNFQVASSGQIQTTEGYVLQNDQGKPLVLNPQIPFEVSVDGVVTQNRKPVGKLRLVDVANPAALRKQGANYFNAPPDPELRPAPKVQVFQGRLESANVPTSESAVRLVSVMRQFESLQRALTIGNEMNKRAVEEVARVNS